MSPNTSYLKDKIYEPEFRGPEKFQIENDINTYVHRQKQQDKTKMINTRAENYLKFFLNNKGQIRYSPYAEPKPVNNPIIKTPSKEQTEFDDVNPYLYYKRTRLNEVTNPDLYYKIQNGDYMKYRQQQKKVLDYNYDLMQKRYGIKKEVDVNPFNPNLCNDLGTSSLNHNTITNPLPNYTYNKYIEQQINIARNETANS